MPIIDGMNEGSGKWFNFGTNFAYHPAAFFLALALTCNILPVNSRFITPDDGSKDVFVHITEILNSVPLKDGECVEFSTEITSKGVSAVDVKQLNSFGKRS